MARVMSASDEDASDGARRDPLWGGFYLFASRSDHEPTVGFDLAPNRE